MHDTDICFLLEIVQRRWIDVISPVQHVDSADGFLVHKVQGPRDILKCVAGQKAGDIHATVFLKKLDGREGCRPEYAIRGTRRIVEFLEGILGLAHFRWLDHQALAIRTARSPAFFGPGCGKQRAHDFFSCHAIGRRIRFLEIGDDRCSRGCIHLASHIFVFKIAKPAQQTLNCRNLLGINICQAIKTSVRRIAFQRRRRDHALRIKRRRSRDKQGNCAGK